MTRETSGASIIATVMRGPSVNERIDSWISKMFGSVSKKPFIEDARFNLVEHLTSVRIKLCMERDTKMSPDAYAILENAIINAHASAADLAYNDSAIAAAHIEAFLRGKDEGAQAVRMAIMEKMAEATTTEDSKRALLHVYNATSNMVKTK